jgi:nucleoside-diphosphate-sugar epimerase
MSQIEIESLESLNSRINVDRFENARILVTGASGMLGSYLVNSINGLLQLNGKRPARMLLTSRNGNFSNINNLENKNLSYYSGHFDELILDDGFEYVFHAASPASPTQYSDPSAILDANILPLRKISESQTDLIEIIFISAGETYGITLSEGSGREDELFHDIPENRMHYPLAKLAGEEFVRNLAYDKDCEYRIVKLFHCFGPGVRENDGRSFADFIWAVARGQVPKMKSSGDDLRTFLYLEDVVAGLLISNQEGSKLEYNLGGSKLISILDFAKKVMQIGGIEGEPLRLFEETYTHSPHKKIVPNCEWLYSRGWTEFVSLDDAILKTIKSIKAAKGF